MTAEILDVRPAQIEPYDLIGEEGFVQTIHYPGPVLDVAPLWSEIDPASGLLSPVWGEVVEVVPTKPTMRIIRGAPVPVLPDGTAP